MSTNEGRAAAGGPVVVVAPAMALSEAARARLSEALGPGFLVVDIRVAPAAPRTT